MYMLAICFSVLCYDTDSYQVVQVCFHGFGYIWFVSGHKACYSLSHGEKASLGIAEKVYAQFIYLLNFLSLVLFQMWYLNVRLQTEVMNNSIQKVLIICIIWRDDQGPTIKIDAYNIPVNLMDYLSCLFPPHVFLSFLFLFFFKLAEKYSDCTGSLLQLPKDQAKKMKVES